MCLIQRDFKEHGLGVRGGKKNVLFILWFSDFLKEEPLYDDFTAKKKGLKRKRIKDEIMEGTSHSTASPT